MIRVGQGFDVHALVAGRPLVLGGVSIAHTHGLAGHSNADVLIHALCDAMLGAAALGDLGRHFPDSDPQYENIDSRVLLRKTVEILARADLMIINVDATVIAQAPRLAPHITEMRNNLARELRIPTDRVSVKATTTDRLGITGREEAIAALAVVLVQEEPSA